MEVNGQLNAPAASSTGKNPVLTEESCLWGFDPVLAFWGKEKSYAPAKIRTQNWPARRLVTIPPTQSITEYCK